MRPILAVLLLCLASCAFSPPSDNKADWYAKLESGGPAKHIPVSKNPNAICLEICSQYREPMFGVDGLGGSREQIEYWSNLVGSGAIFRDPDIYRNGGGLSWNSHHRGTIIIDRRKNTVVVDLKMIVSNLGEPERLVPSEANGTYQIKRWVR